MVSPFNKRNFFNLQHDKLLTLNMGQLIPVDCVEVLPGDTFKMSNKFFSRLEAMIAPALVDIDLLVHTFYVPSRILMNNDEWESFITGGKDGDGALDGEIVVAPYMMSPEGGYAPRSLADYLGVPTGVANLKHSAFPFRAYAKIFNEWFRDENLVAEIGLSLADGLDETTNTELQNKAWEKDYFTSALPWPQRGDAATIPIGSQAVVGNGTAIGLTNGTENFGSIVGLGSQYGFVSGTNAYGATVGESLIGTPPTNSNTVMGLTTDPTKSGLVTDSSLNPVTINDLRTAFQVQRFLEKQVRGGARLVETILSHFGVRVPDARLQRSEYLGGGRLRYMVSPIEQTSATQDGVSTPQGNLTGRGTLNAQAKNITKSFVEHGYVMTLISVMPRTLYSQGLHRMWSRDSRYDYFWPVFAHLGEQAVLNKEIYAQGTDADEAIFGFNDRSAEYRYIPSTVHGLFRPGQSLEYWTLARKFDSLPQLNAQFVTADPSKRIFAVQNDSTDSIVMQYRSDITAYRPIPKYGNPGLIDHD